MAAKTKTEAPSPEAQLESLNGRLEPRQQKFVRAVRAALRKRLPTANELAYDYTRFVSLAYSPTENGIDAILSIAARPDRVDLYFNHGPRLPDPKKLLRGSGRMARFIQLESVRQLSHPDVKALLAAAIESSPVRLPSKGKGRLIIKTNKMLPASKRPRRSSARR